MEQYIIPANSKRGQLIFSIFKWSDLILLLIGALVSFILLFAIKGDGIAAMIIKLAPVGTCIFLVWPIPYYHNILTFLKEMFNFLLSPVQNRYYWRGWCSTYVDSED